MTESDTSEVLSAEQIASVRKTASRAAADGVATDDFRKIMRGVMTVCDSHERLRAPRGQRPEEHGAGERVSEAEAERLILGRQNG